VHQYTLSGQYQVDIFRHEKLTSSIVIDVSSEYGDKQLSIDLAVSNSRPSPVNDCTYKLSTEGYAVFFVGSGSGGYAVKSYPLASKDEEQVFDSRRLNAGDLFGLTLLRPGQYRIEETSRKIALGLYVGEVEPGKNGYVPPAALHLDIDQLEKANEHIRVQQAQGIVFRTDNNNRVIITFSDDNAKEDDKPQQTAHWKKSSAQKR
jgi:hypothetical protein